MAALPQGRFDPATILFALLFVAYRSLRKRGFTLAQASRDLMDGAAIFPLLALAGSGVSRRALELLLNGNRAILSIAGMFALMAVLQVDRSEPPTAGSLGRVTTG